VAIDLANEAQRQVKLRIVLPAGVLDSSHDREQALADRCRRTYCNEEAVHERRGPSASMATREPVFLESTRQ
jgi:hypothetical protein